MLARRLARPWGEVLRPLNKVSDNALTRLLYLNLGVPAMAAQPQATTAELAAREVRAWLVEHGIDPAGVVMDNGSGLSRSERIAPLQLAQMIRAAWHGRHAPELLMSLPVAGVDGTMRNRLKDSPAAGWARLQLDFDGQRLLMGPERRKATFGRDHEADFTVQSPTVSRAHAMIERRRERFVLVDHSLNGSFVTFEGKPEMKLRHEELTLVGHGWIAFGQPRADAQQVAEFHCLEPADADEAGRATSAADAAPATRPAPR